ncbi:MAG: indolepyruvate ferredoxin oxidoreductase family protein [Chloroflexi bacterium]|nr:indolepyruvate ferredoxin oxidoreductase family protein [Chloroflexota bacterium]
MTAKTVREVTLDDRYLVEEGLVYLNGTHALVRLPLDQARRDRRAGLRIGTFITGYPGSPLGGYDLALQRIKPLLDQYDIRQASAPNEEQAATALMGTQMLDNHPHSRYDGVVGIWYGKGPGVDRSGDALKHGNFAGTSQHGAVIVLSGDDHEAKSSTMPFQDDYAFMTAGIPVLYPGSVGEFLTLGLHAIALSRYSGCWVALKIVNTLADGGETVYVHPADPPIVLPELEINGRPFVKKTDFTFFPGKNIEQERHLFEDKHRAVIAYTRANGLNRIELRGPDDRIGIVTCGKSYADTRQALRDLGLDDAELRRRGIRLLRVGLTYPLDEQLVREFAQGLQEVIVVEEKRPFLEQQVKAALCGVGGVRVVGKHDEADRVLLPVQGGHDQDLLAERLGERLLPHLGAHAGVMRRLAELRAIRSRQYELFLHRTPNYCSGCPHNTSTRLLEGEVAWGSPGCHSFASIMEQPHKQIMAMTQYGGEGLPWIGLAPYTDREHIVQNVGDGSFFHSSYLNLRFLVAQNPNITLKILYNGFIANTGAQAPTGQKDIPELTRLLELEGVKHVALVTKEPERYRGVALGATTRVWPAEEIAAAQQYLREQGGVTVLIYDGMCANERRRQQKRGKLPTPNQFVVINEAVCEACGHCGELTNCMSLQRVETEFGPKTQVHQSSCNQDYSCLKGDCPSFVTVETAPGTGLARPLPPPLAADAVSEPADKVVLQGPYRIYIPGVGGTGVLTLNALLCYAAVMDGQHVLSYDQTGAAQKGGPVLSSLIIAPGPDTGGEATNGHAALEAPTNGATAPAPDGRRAQRWMWANKVGMGQADLYLALDLVGAVTPVNLDRCTAERTAALVNTSLTPTGEMVRNIFLTAPRDRMLATLAKYTRAADNLLLDANRLCEGLFGDHMLTNTFALGAAYQRGWLPLRAESIEAAIRLNGVQVEENLQAFRYGRLAVHDPERVERLVAPPPPTAAEEQHTRRARLRPADAAAYEALLARCAHLDPEAQRLLAIRVAELIAYQDARWAGAYVDFVLRVAAREQEATPGRTALTHAVIRYLFKLMAYKDEYEVARLHLHTGLQERIAEQFEQPLRRVYHLHPPLLRQLGLKRKLQLDAQWFDPALHLLYALRGLRGTPLDVFGRTAHRRLERRLIGWYARLVGEALARLSPATHAVAVELATLPDLIRGYEQIKERNIEAARQRAAELLERLRAPSATAGATATASLGGAPPAAQ